VKRILASAIALMLAGCASSVPVAVGADAAASPAQTAGVSDAASCAARGGAIQPVCRMQRPMCVIHYADAGKACVGDADCEGKCRARDDAVYGQAAAGVCQATSDPCGCHANVEGGIAQPRICVD
jgi:hypothetical protein